MTPDDVTLIKDSFALVVPISEQAAEMFYARLFEIAPDVRPLFKADMKEQGRKLMATLGLVVSSLDRLDSILPAIKSLAVRHVDYGVKAEQYDDVGAALLWTLKQGLGSQFTAAHQQAWDRAYGLLAQAMREAAQESGVAVK